MSTWADDIKAKILSYIMRGITLISLFLQNGMGTHNIGAPPANAHKFAVYSHLKIK